MAMGNREAKPDIVLVCGKYPHLGKVKTRLAATVGEEQAAQFSHQWIGEILRNISAIRAEGVRIIGFFDGANRASLEDWNLCVDEWWEQPTGDLGERLAHGFDRGHCVGEKVVAIGVDCLDVDAALLREALNRLEAADVVFGPATDGGYYLVGAARHVPRLFRQPIRWSTGATMADHLEHCHSLQLSTAFLAPLSDLDTEADWLAYCRRRQATR